MGRRIAKLGPRTKVNCDPDDASGRGRDCPVDPSGQLQAHRHGLPGFQETPLQHPHSKAVALRTVPDRHDSGAEPCFTTHEAGRRPRGRNTQAAAKRERSKRRRPESGAKLSTVHRNEERTGQTPGCQHRTPIRRRTIGNNNSKNPEDPAADRLPDC